jgi:hypothetical protein
MTEEELVDIVTRAAEHAHDELESLKARRLAFMSSFFFVAHFLKETGERIETRCCFLCARDRGQGPARDW